MIQIISIFTVMNPYPWLCHESFSLRSVRSLNNPLIWRLGRSGNPLKVRCSECMDYIVGNMLNLKMVNWKPFWAVYNENRNFYWRFRGNLLSKIVSITQSCQSHYHITCSYHLECKNKLDLKSQGRPDTWSGLLVIHYLHCPSCSSCV